MKPQHPPVGAEVLEARLVSALRIAGLRSHTAGTSNYCWLFRDLATIEFRFDTLGRFVLSTILTQPEVRGQGHASALLKAFCSVADAIGSPVALCPEPLVAFGEPCPLSKQALRDWYARYGFVTLESGWMGRNPR